MWFMSRRARRIAETRRQLARLCGGEPRVVDLPALAESPEYAGRGHLFSAASWLIVRYLRAVHDARSRAPTRSDYLLDLLRGPGTRRDHPVDR
jgi:hypothetical protein